MKTDSPKSVNIPRIVTGTAIFMLFTPLASFVLNSGSIIGMAIGAAMILSGVFPRKIKDAISEIKKKKGGSAVLKIIAAIFIIIAVYCTALTAIIMSFGANSRDIPTDTPAIVLGCKVNDDEPSLMLKKRIDAAYEYLEENENAVVIASGGKGDDENISEAEAVGNALEEKGISRERIIIEDSSTSTAENMLFSKKIMDENGMGAEAVIITTEFHQFRASLLAKRNGITPYRISSKSNPFSLPTAVVREWLAVLATLLK